MRVAQRGDLVRAARRVSKDGVQSEGGGAHGPRQREHRRAERVGEQVRSVGSEEEASPGLEASE